MERLKVLTLNIWNRSGPWERRLELIREGIKTLNPDVIGLQEVLSQEGGACQADEVAEGLGYERYFSSAWKLGGGILFGNAVLSRFPILEGETMQLPVRAGNEGRALAFCVLDAPCGRVPVFVTHLSWKLHHVAERKIQVSAIAREVKKRAPLDGFPPILMGDMNAEPDADEMRFLRGLATIDDHGVYFADCWDCCGNGPGHTYARDNGYALRTRELSRRIDYIYVRGPDRQLRGEPLTASVVFNEASDGVYASDHYGVYAEIQAAPRPLDAV